jgi:hypothetical protein
MARVHPDATLVPHFRDFLPAWLAKQPWYREGGPAPISAVGFLRLEDPAGEVGIETHLVRGGEHIYQIPMTYRGAPLESAAGSLITTAEHSVLGPRWIYDATADPVWISEIVRLVRTGSSADPSAKRGAGAATATGHRTAVPWPSDGAPAVEVRRVLDLDWPVDESTLVGTLEGTWEPDGAGRLAVVVAEKRDPVA